ncbi:hypothetical protein LTR85_012268 [Meristemomyces frigidus]|nr:hypothetical protein LTR85_012268 [Meristemomyces frigidus]
MMWGPYTAASAFMEGQLIVNQRGSRLLNRNIVLDEIEKPKMIRSMSVSMAEGGTLDVKPYLVSDFF